MKPLSLLVLFAAFVVGCGGEPASSTPTDAGGSADAGAANPCLTDAGLVITFTSTGVSPRMVTVDAGTILLVRNDDTQAHQLASEPHPVHNTCPQVNTAALAAGQCEVKTLSTAGDCSFHDHTRPTNSAFAGELIVQ